MEEIKCSCNDMGFFIYVWSVLVSRGILEHYRFPIPCARCNLVAYTQWIIKNHDWVQSITGHIVDTEMIVATTAAN